MSHQTPNPATTPARIHALPAMVSTAAAVPQATPVMAHSATHTLKLLPATQSVHDQPVDLAAKPRLSPAPSSPASTPTVSNKAMSIQVPNLANLVGATAQSQAQRSPGSTTTIHTLRIPSLPQSLRPATVQLNPASSRSAATLTPSGAPQVITGPGLVIGRGGTGQTAAMIPRLPGTAATLLAMPKNASSPGHINLAVVQQVAPGNKVVIQAPSPSSKPGVVQVPRATATTIIRQPSAQYPMTIRTPLQQGGSNNGATAIRLTASAPAGTNQPTVQFVPVSLTTSGGATLRPAGTLAPGTAAGGGIQAVSFRQGPATILATQRNSPGQAESATGTPGGAAVRVTLVQPSTVGAKSVVSQAAITQSNFYKPVTITTQQPATSAGGTPQQIRTSTVATPLVPTPLSSGMTTQPVRIGPLPAGTTRAVLHPVVGSGGSGGQPLTVSLTPASHISVPLTPNLLGAKQSVRLPNVTASSAGKLVQMPIVAAANSSSVQPSGVTIQKATIPVNTIPRTISLPYGTTTQVSAIAKPSVAVSGLQGAQQTIPVARVCPQPLNVTHSNNSAAPNLVTITSTVSNEVSQQQALPGNVYLARAPAASSSTGQLAINMTSGVSAKIISQTHRGLSLDPVSLSTQIVPNSATSKTSGANAKANPHAQPTRFLMAPMQSGGAIAATTTISTSQQQLEHDIYRKLIAVGAASSSPYHNVIASQSSSRPGILGGGEGDRDVAGDLHGNSTSRDVDGDDAGSFSSGSTTLSATSSPGEAGNLSGGEGDVIEQQQQPSSQNPSPRKKQRKQQFPPSDGQSQSWMLSEEGEQMFTSSIPKRKLPTTMSDVNRTSKLPPSTAPQKPTDYFVTGKPRVSLINSYRHTWRSRHNHFLRHSDVRVKEAQRPTVNELANQNQVLQKLNGWKIHHLSAQMDEIIESEMELTKKLGGLHKKLEKTAASELGSRDLSKVNELIKANLQRSKVVQDQIQEARSHALELFQHKDKVKEIVNKYVSKRHVKKREFR